MKKILIIEDDAALSGSLAQRLKAEGFEVSLAPDGEAGLKILETSRPDLILLDLVLPRKTGFEVLSELKKRKELAAIPILVLTNLESPFDIEKALQFGVKEYLVKANYSLNEIVKKIKQVLI
ncbi:MAG: response regulator [bacterium]|nr:response regulator [bacterium]